MNFQEYSDRAIGTIVLQDERGFDYAACALAEEAGEVCGKVKRLYRDYGEVPSIEWRNAMLEECGDVLWNINRLVLMLGYDLETCAKRNIEKVESRRLRGVTRGSGDNR